MTFSGDWLAYAWMHFVSFYATNCMHFHLERVLHRRSRAPNPSDATACMHRYLQVNSYKVQNPWSEQLSLFESHAVVRNYLVGVNVQLSEVRIKQQLRRVYTDRRLTLAFTAQHPLRVDKTPEIRPYTQHQHNNRLLMQPIRWSQQKHIGLLPKRKNNSNKKQDAAGYLGAAFVSRRDRNICSETWA